MITKGDIGDSWGIGLVEVLWKTVVGLLNQQFTAAITFHDFLHGFRMGRGMGTITLEVKLIHQLRAMREALLYKEFMDFNKELVLVWVDRPIH